MGPGVEKDLSKAIALYERACPVAEPAACDNLCLIYYRGAGVDKDIVKAKDYYVLGYYGDDAPSCGALGNIYETD